MKSPKRSARIAGLLYLFIFIGAGLSYGYVQANILEPGDAAATARNITAAGWMFRLCVAAGILAFVCDIAVAAIFYMLLKPVSSTLSLMAAFFRLAQTAILGLNLIWLLLALNVVSGTGQLTVPGAEQQQGMALLFINAFQWGFDIAMVFFGMHCLLLGWLFYRSAYFTKWLGVLITLAGITYLADSFTKFLLPQYGEMTALVVGITAIVAELCLAVWLLVKGVREQPAPAAA